MWSYNYTGSTSVFEEKCRVGLHVTNDLQHTKLGELLDNATTDCHSFLLDLGVERNFVKALGERFGSTAAHQNKTPDTISIRFPKDFDVHRSPTATAERVASVRDTLGGIRIALVVLPWPNATAKERVESVPSAQSRDGVRFAKTWAALQGLVDRGFVGRLGLEECLPWQIDMVQQKLNLHPAANLLSIDPVRQRRYLSRYCNARGIEVVACLHTNALKDTANVFDKIRDEHHMYPLQALTSWCLHKGIVVLHSHATLVNGKTGAAHPSTANIKQASDEVFSLLNPLARRSCYYAPNDTNIARPLLPEAVALIDSLGENDGPPRLQVKEFVRKPRKQGILPTPPIETLEESGTLPSEPLLWPPSSLPTNEDLVVNDKAERKSSTIKHADTSEKDSVVSLSQNDDDSVPIDSKNLNSTLNMELFQGFGSTGIDLTGDEEHTHATSADENLANLYVEVKPASTTSEDGQERGARLASDGSLTSTFRALPSPFAQGTVGAFFAPDLYSSLSVGGEEVAGESPTSSDSSSDIFSDRKPQHISASIEQKSEGDIPKSVSLHEKARTIEKLPLSTEASAAYVSQDRLAVETSRSKISSSNSSDLSASSGSALSSHRSSLTDDVDYEKSHTGEQVEDGASPFSTEKRKSPKEAKVKYSLKVDALHSLVSSGKLSDFGSAFEEEHKL